MWKQNSKKDIFFGRFKNYLVKFNGIIFNIITLKDSNVDDSQDTEVYGTTEEEKEKNKNRIFVHKIEPEGCGSNLNWETLEDVTDMVNAELKKTFADKTYDNKMKDEIHKSETKCKCFNFLY